MLDIVHDASGHGAVVEDVGPALRDPLVRVRQFGESNNVVFFQDVSLRVTKHSAGTGTTEDNRRGERTVKIFNITLTSRCTVEDQNIFSPPWVIPTESPRVVRTCSGLQQCILKLT